MACDLATIQEEACESEIGRLSSEMKLLQVIAQLSCDLAASAALGPIAPGVVNPNGVVVGSPGQTYYNSATAQLWIKESGTATNTGWVPY